MSTFWVIYLLIAALLALSALPAIVETWVDMDGDDDQKVTTALHAAICFGLSLFWLPMIAVLIYFWLSEQTGMDDEERKEFHMGGGL